MTAVGFRNLVPAFFLSSNGECRDPKGIQRCSGIFCGLGERFLASVFFYCQRFHKGVFEWGLLSKKKVNTSVVGVGNVEAGGTGKTSTVVDLANRLVQEGLKTVVVVRGYRKTGKSRLFVVSCEQTVNPSSIVGELGDEGAMIADALGGKRAWVVSARRKWKGVVWADKALRPDVILVDDALQHYALVCDAMLIVGTHPNAVAQGQLLPLGRLREKPRRVLKAHKEARWIWTRTLGTEKVAPMEYVWTREFLGCVSLENSKERLRVQSDRGVGLNVLCGIGDWRSFVEALRAFGIRIGTVVAARDHERFCEKRVKMLVTEVSNTWDWVVTPKDAVKLCSTWFLPRNVWVACTQVVWGQGFDLELWPWLLGKVRRRL